MVLMAAPKETATVRAVKKCALKENFYSFPFTFQMILILRRWFFLLIPVLNETIICNNKSCFDRMTWKVMIWLVSEWVTCWLSSHGWSIKWDNWEGKKGCLILLLLFLLFCICLMDVWYIFLWDFFMSPAVVPWQLHCPVETIDHVFIRLCQAASCKVWGKMGVGVSQILQTHSKCKWSKRFAEWSMFRVIFDASNALSSWTTGRSSRWSTSYRSRARWTFWCACPASFKGMLFRWTEMYQDKHMTASWYEVRKMIQLTEWSGLSPVARAK